LIVKGADDLAALGVGADNQAQGAMAIDVIVAALGIILDDENDRIAPENAFADGFNDLAQGEIIVGVIYDPMRDEMWSGQKGESPRLNGHHFRVSARADLAEAVVSVGLSKTGVTIEAGLPLLQQMIHRARKCRLLGSAALDMAYVACGRLDAYIEQGISLWDIAAGWILVETAGGTVDLRPRQDMKNKYSIVASNGVIDLKL